MRVQKQSGVRSASGGAGDVSRAGGLLYLAVRRRTRRNVCLHLQPAQKRCPPHRHLSAQGRLRSGTRRCRSSRNRAVKRNARRQRDCPLQPKRKRRRMRRERLRGGLPVVDAPALAKKQNASALFLTRRRKGVSLLRRIWNAAMRAAFPKSRRARTQLALMCR